MMINLKQIAFASVLLTLFACSANDTKDENSAFYSVPVGSSIVLNRDVTISGEQVAIYTQNGELMSYDEVDKYNPNCKFEIYTMSKQPRTVHRDTFEIIKVVDEIESSSLKKSVQVAMPGDAMMFGSLDRSYVFNYATMMYLNSEKQKDVYRMTCQHWEDIMDDRYLTVAQMREAMGVIFTLVIKKE
jgi:hypothetical protein